MASTKSVQDPANTTVRGAANTALVKELTKRPLRKAASTTRVGVKGIKGAAIEAAKGFRDGGIEAVRKAALEERDTEARARQAGGGRKKRRTGKKRKASAKFLAAGNAWRAHLTEYRKKHPKKSLKQQMKGASKTYKKVKGKLVKSKPTVDIEVPGAKISIKSRRRKKASRTKRRR